MRVSATVSPMTGVVVALGVLLAPATAFGETIEEALALAYTNNPTLNAQRAATRAIDENVPIAWSQLRPFITGNADKRYSHEVTNHGPGVDTFGRSISITIAQTLWDSFKTRNDVAAARAAVYASRETLRNTEQNVLFNAAAAYMDVIRDQAIAGYRSRALEFLDELVRSEQARFDVGESTRTDVAQAEASRALARSQLSAARAQLKSSVAIYRQIIGVEPKRLRSPVGVYSLAPKRIDQALDIAFVEHPAIQATKYLVDQASWNVKSAESDLLPRVTLEGSSSKSWSHSNVLDRTVASQSVIARLSVPIYQGGLVSAQVRQNKETLGQRRIEVDETVDQVRAAVISAYSQFEAASASSLANNSQLRAANLALEGAIEERKVGQRTTLDVLQSQQAVIDAQVLLATSQRDAIVAGYAVLSAIGRLSSDRLRLNVAHYDPVDHYEVVKDKWFGLRTPDGH